VVHLRHSYTKEIDADAGLTYMYQRWYDQTTGRFASVAPYGPMRKHPYGFAMQSPVLGIDVYGQFPVDFDEIRSSLGERTHRTGKKYKYTNCHSVVRCATFIDCGNTGEPQPELEYPDGAVEISTGELESGLVLLQYADDGSITHSVLLIMWGGDWYIYHASNEREDSQYPTVHLRPYRDIWGVEDIAGPNQKVYRILRPPARPTPGAGSGGGFTPGGSTVRPH